MRSLCSEVIGDTKLKMVTCENIVNAVTANLCQEERSIDDYEPRTHPKQW